jgi:hypothetical protein
MTIRSNTRVLALAGAAAALVAAALALWLSAAGPSHAGSADQVQGTAVTVADRTVTWGSADDCVQNMDTADFGSMLAGSSAQLFGFKGCVTSNASGWGVSASATDLTRPGEFQSIPAGNLALRTSELSGSAAGTAAQCATFNDCSLGASQTLLSGGSAGSGGFIYDYYLLVPSNTPAGNYTGTVTFTAAN